jgi:hypothetical protein
MHLPAAGCIRTMPRLVLCEYRRSPGCCNLIVFRGVRGLEARVLGAGGSTASGPDLMMLHAGRQVGAVGIKIGSSVIL